MENRKAKFTSVLNTVTEALSSKESYQGLFHQHNEGEPIPSSKTLKEIVNLLRAILFPGYYGKSSICSSTIKYHIGVHVERVYEQLSKQILAGICFSNQQEAGDDVCAACSKEEHKRANKIATLFLESLPEMRTILATDVRAAYEGDPAATSYGEIIACYPGIKAITNYRIAHKLLQLEVPLIPRMITELAHSETGIDIHPGAQIGTHFSIDHGTGVVIGATSIIGNHVQLYQGVTLGAKSFPLDDDGNPIKGIPRHPILKDHVCCYSNSTILGRITIGEGSVIGGNVWVTENVAPGIKIVQPKPKHNIVLNNDSTEF